MDARVFERRQVVFDVLEVDQLADGIFRRPFWQSLGFFGSSTKTCALEKVRGKIVVPIGRPNWSEVILPLSGSGFLRQGERRQTRNKRENHGQSSHIRTPW